MATGGLSITIKLIDTELFNELVEIMHEMTEDNRISEECREYYKTKILSIIDNVE